MKTLLVCLWTLAFGCCGMSAQDRVTAPASSSTPLSSPAVAPELGPPVAITNNPPERKVNWLRLAPNLVHDQKQIWLFPRSLAEGKHIRPALAFVAATAALVAVGDVPVAKYFRNTTSFSGFNRVFSTNNTSAGMIALPSAFYSISLLRGDNYGQHTYLLAGEAVLDSEILTTIIKDTDRRIYPGNVPPNGNFADTWFRKTSGSYIGGFGSFPSGHGIAAFSLATVFANRYPHKLWFRELSYGLATAVSLSRLSLQAHFLSDSFAGGVLGYTIARRVVLQAP